MRRFELFLDESGTFTETAPGARGDASQLVGILAPAGVLSVPIAEKLLRRALSTGGIELGVEMHTTDLGAHSGLSVAVDALLDELVALDARPVRLRNSEQVHFGDKPAAYTRVGRTRPLLHGAVGSLSPGSHVERIGRV